MKKKMDQTGKDKNKLFRDMIRVDVLEDEIKYAKSQLQPEDTGHIHTAISWLKHRVNQLKGIKDDD
mgnify:FL=1|tara:strand:+ start:11570 stop:11767 length:198 start_codon:yes stop_codon:yes gene_type:complete